MFRSTEKEIKTKQAFHRPAIRSHSGFAAIISLIVMSVLAGILVLSIGGNIFTKARISEELFNSAQSYYSAESGMEDAVYRKIKGYNLPSGNLSLDGASIDQTINTVGSVTTIDSASTYGNDVRKLRSLLTITTTSVSFHYGVQIGEGGLTMANGAVINGNLYSDGSVQGGSNDSKITGDVYVATGMELDDNGIWENYSNDRNFSAKNSSIIDIAMKFTPNSSGKLSQISFNVKKSDTLPDASILIVTDNGGSPSTTLVEPTASTTFSASKIGTNYSWVNFTFSNPPNLTASTDYWIVINADESNNAGRYYSIGRSTGNTDISKYGSNWSSGSWTTDKTDDNINYGYEYKAWIGGQPTTLDSVIVGGNAYAHKITNSNSTARICGNAYYQEIDSNSLSFLNNPTSSYCDSPLTPGTAHSDYPDPAVVAMPLSSGNIADWEAAASEAGDLNSALCASSSDNITLNAGVLNCDFAPSSSNLVITLNGTVWIKGDASLPNNAIVQLASGYGANSGIIIADAPNPSAKGKINTGNGTLICGSQGYNSGNPPACKASNSSYIMMLSTYSGTGNAINISNNASGAIYYAFSGTANVSNNASNVKEVTAYKLNLENGSSVTYESGLANAAFSSGPGGGWAINNWNETE